MKDRDPNCIFCQIVAGTSPSEKVYEDEYVTAFMDIFPATRGHLLIAANVHAENLLELPDEYAVATMRAALKIAPALKEAVQADGLNMLQSNGKAAWQSVDHFHMHLIPRYLDDGISPPFRTQPADPSKLKTIARSIEKAI